MNDPNIIDILNELLAAERSSAAQRLIESTVFVTQTGSDEHLNVKRLAEEQAEATPRCYGSRARVWRSMLRRQADHALGCD
jgi:hypothetical protein